MVDRNRSCFDVPKRCRIEIATPFTQTALPVKRVCNESTGRAHQLDTEFHVAFVPSSGVIDHQRPSDKRSNQVQNDAKLEEKPHFLF